MEVAGDFFYEGKWQISWFYSFLFGLSLATYIVLRALKKRHLLDVEGR
jgi:hypothetical protein